MVLPLLRKTVIHSAHAHTHACCLQRTDHERATERISKWSGEWDRWRGHRRRKDRLQCSTMCAKSEQEHGRGMLQLCLRLLSPLDIKRVVSFDCVAFTADDRIHLSTRCVHFVLIISSRINWRTCRRSWWPIGSRFLAASFDLVSALVRDYDSHIHQWSNGIFQLAKSPALQIVIQCSSCILIGKSAVFNAKEQSRRFTYRLRVNQS